MVHPLLEAAEPAVDPFLQRVELGVESLFEARKAGGELLVPLFVGLLEAVREQAVDQLGLFAEVSLEGFACQLRLNRGDATTLPSSSNEKQDRYEGVVDSAYGAIDQIAEMCGSEIRATRVRG